MCQNSLILGLNAYNFQTITSINNCLILKITPRSIFPNMPETTTRGGGIVQRTNHKVSKYSLKIYQRQKSRQG